MDQQAPITWLITTITDKAAAQLPPVTSAIANVIAPLAAIGFGIYILLVTVNYMRGSESEPVIDFAMRLASWSLIITLGLNAANYSAYIVPIVRYLGSDIAMSFSASPAGNLDSLVLHYLKIIDEGYSNAPTFINPAKAIAYYVFTSIKVFIVLFGLCPLIILCILAIVSANIGGILCAMVGPIFFAFLLFPATRQYFSAWVNSVFSYVLIPIFVGILCAISASIATDMFSSNGSTLSDTTFLTVCLGAIGNLALCFVLKNVAGPLASALSAGGINAAMPGSLGGMSSAVKSMGRASSPALKAAASGAGRGAAGAAGYLDRVSGGHGAAASSRMAGAVRNHWNNPRGNKITKAG